MKVPTKAQIMTELIEARITIGSLEDDVAWLRNRIAWHDRERDRLMTIVAKVYEAVI